ncbi:MAG: hypothetical protein AAGA55_03705 [Planctomycetota bacterium]
MDLKPLIVVSAGLVFAGIAGCSDSSSSDSGDIVPDSGYGTEGLDALGGNETEPAEPESKEPDPVVIDQGGVEDDGMVEEARDWERERESQSLLGRSRDKAKTLRNSIQGGTEEPENGLAVTRPDEEWVGTGGWAWDMPQGWRMAVPGSGRFGEMYVASDFGAATVTFERDRGAVAELERRVGSMVVDLIGSRVTPRVSSFDVGGLPVKLLSLEGTYIDPSGKGGGNEKPFYAVRGAIVDLGDERAVVVLVGPETTVTNHAERFENMIRGMYQR